MAPRFVNPITDELFIILKRKDHQFQTALLRIELFLNTIVQKDIGRERWLIQIRSIG